jgi:hypothetical protein
MLWLYVFLGWMALVVTFAAVMHAARAGDFVNEWCPKCERCRQVRVLQ